MKIPFLERPPTGRKRPLVAFGLAILCLADGILVYALNLLLLLGIDIGWGSSEEFQALGAAGIFLRFVGPALSILAGTALLDLRRDSFWYFVCLALWYLKDQTASFLELFAVVLLVFYVASVTRAPRSERSSPAPGPPPVLQR